MEQENNIVHSDLVIQDKERVITIENLIDQQDLVLNDIAIERNKVISKLANAISNMNLDLEQADLDTVSKKISAITTLDQLLASKEKSYNSRITTRLKNKELSNNTQIGTIVTSLLNKINVKDLSMNSNVNIREENNKAISDLENRSKEVNVLDTECRTDSKDYSE